MKSIKDRMQLPLWMICLVSLAASGSALSSSSTATNTNTKASLSQATTLSAVASSSDHQEDVTTASTTKFNPLAWKRPGHPSSKGCSPCPNNDNEEDQKDLLALLFGPPNEEEETKPDSVLFSSTDYNNDNNNNKKDMDRREATFAMLGTLWATTTTATSALSFPQAAHAVYGAEPKIELPNMIDGMNNRATKQCLVESLGNRECLVYMDPDNKLYQGVDSQKLLQKVDTSSVALAKIPQLVEEKKWSGVKSIITGPMGELLTTMNLLAPLSTQQPDRSTALAKQVKLQIFDISAAVDVKDGKRILKSTEGATDALVAFVKSL